MSAPARPPRGLQGWAGAALAAALGLALLQALRGDGRLLGAAVPLSALLGLALAGGLAGGLAVHRRSAPLALGAGALLVLAVLPGGSPAPGPAGYALGILFGAALVAFGEAVHAARRHERARAALGADAPAGDHLARETRRTLLARVLAAAGLAAAGLLLALLLSFAGPLQLREAVETAAPLGVALASLSLMGGAALFVLARGARLRKAETPPQEIAPDAHD